MLVASAAWADAAHVAWAPGLPAFLRDVSFEARQGELIGVVGETGAGKTGLFAALLGEIPAFCGQNLEAPPPTTEAAGAPPPL
ncbi:MAG: ATP-binding cassette domain-containing protein, partial [Phycisphaerales bacterium]